MSNTDYYMGHMGPSHTKTGLGVMQRDFQTLNKYSKGIGLTFFQLFESSATESSVLPKYLFNFTHKISPIHNHVYYLVTTVLM